MMGRVSGVQIRGIVAAVPKERKGVSDLYAVFGEEEANKIALSTGVKHRRVAGDMCASDLMAASAERLMSDLGWSADAIDAIVVVTQTPDYFLPATACVLHGKLGLTKKAMAFDVNMGCSGYVYGLWILESLMAQSGMKKALLLVGDTSTRLVSDTDRSTVPLFGDAGTATALEWTGVGDSYFHLGTDGSGASFLNVPAGGFRERASESTRKAEVGSDGNCRTREQLYMDGPEVFSFTSREVPKMIDTILEFASIEKNDIDFYVFHQANEFLLKFLEKKIKITSSKAIYSLGEFGNTSSASIPVTIVANRSIVGMMGSSRVLLAGFGVGFSWGSAVLDFDALSVLGLLEIE